MGKKKKEEIKRHVQGDGVISVRTLDRPTTEHPLHGCTACLKRASSTVVAGINNRQQRQIKPEQQGAIYVAKKCQLHCYRLTKQQLENKAKSIFGGSGIDQTESGVKVTGRGRPRLLRVSPVAAQGILFIGSKVKTGCPNTRPCRVKCRKSKRMTCCKALGRPWGAMFCSR